MPITQRLALIVLMPLLLWNGTSSSQTTIDDFGNFVDKDDCYQTRDSFGNIVNTCDKGGFQTNDSFGNLVNSTDCFSTIGVFGTLERSNGCSPQDASPKINSAIRTEAPQNSKPSQPIALPQSQSGVPSRSLGVTSRCLVGKWKTSRQGNNSDSGNLEILSSGAVYMGGNLVSASSGTNVSYVDNQVILYTPRATETMSKLRIAYRYARGSLVGSVSYAPLKKGFFKTTELPRVELPMTGLRLGSAPQGCTATSSSISPATSDLRDDRGQSIADGLSDLSKLYSEGLLDDEEYSAAKRRLLGL